MNRSTHLSEVELLELIHGEGESEESHSFGLHLHHCRKCRQALEELSARSAIWKKAPKMLKDSDLCKSSRSLNSKVESDGNSRTEWHYPIDELLDQPKHPEMMGRIGKYDIEREVGRGGMGVVLKAHDSELNRPVAIKILAPHLANHATARRRFAQEAIAAAGVLHPNVIAVHGVSHEGKTPYIVMPYIDGPSLQTVVERQGPLAEIEIVRIALQISSGLAAAHSQGLVHRDIKPANILVETGVNRVMITDFGLARVEDDASLTNTGWLMGTPNYMSPEQTRGQRTDQRSLGSLIYFLATGRLPFRAETPLGVLHRIQNDEPTPVQEVNSQISRTLSDVIAMLLRKSTEARFQKAADLHDLLEKHLAYLHQPDVSKPPSVYPYARSELSKRRVAFGGFVIATAMAAMAIGYSERFSLSLLTDSSSSNAQIDQKQNNSADSQKSDRASNRLSIGLSEDEEVASTRLDSDKKDNAQAYRPLSRAKYAASQGRFADAEKLCLEALEIDPTNDDAATNLGYVIGMQGRQDDAFPWYERAAKSVHFKALGNYNLACFYATKGEKETAFDYLDKSICNGLKQQLCIDEIKADPDLKSIREDPRFELAVQSIQQCEQ
jgi:eukaryotic-like serine/threonine-protein kinase